MGIPVLVRLGGLAMLLIRLEGLAMPFWLGGLAREDRLGGLFMPEAALALLLGRLSVGGPDPRVLTPKLSLLTG